MNEPVDLQSMDEAQMRQMLQHLMSELKHKQTLLDKLSYEMAILKRLKFAAKTEALNADQRSLLEDALEEDLQAVDEEIEQRRSAEERSPRQQPKRLPLPAQLLRQEFTHEPEVTECCGQAMRRMDVLTLLTFVWPQVEAAFPRHPAKLLVVGASDSMRRGASSASPSRWSRSGCSC